MFKKLGRTLHLFYSVSLLIILVSLSFVLYSYWNVGLFDGSKISGIYEVSYKIKEIEEKKVFSQIKKLSNSADTRLAMKQLEFLKSDLKLVNKNVSFVDGRELETDLSNLENKLNNINSMPRAQEVVSIFSSKLDKFSSFVQYNKWRTLTRISKRMKTRIPSVGRMTVKSLKKSFRSIAQDIAIMRNVTNGSVLSTSDKNIIGAKLDSLKTEVSLVEKFVDAYKPYGNELASFSNKYSAKLSELGPAMALAKLKTAGSTKQLSFGIFAIICFAVFGFFALQVLYRKNSKAQQSFVEENLVAIMKKGVLNERSEIPKGLSENTQEEISRTHEFLKKRMKFGRVFEATLPFSAVLMDANLKVIWGNDNFYRDWDLMAHSDNPSDISWDYLKQMTNLGDTDPILDANKNGIAGIYQIQLNLDESKNPLPYEMYVNPVEMNAERSTMAYFYPLSAMEQTISDQVKTVISPVNRFINAVTTNAFSGETRETLGNEFTNAGIEDVFNGLTAYYENSCTQRQGLLNEISSLEESQAGLVKVLEEINTIQTEKKINLDKGLLHLNKTKKGVIRYVDANAENEKMYSSIFGGLKSIIKNYTGLLKKAEEFHTSLRENLDVIESITSMRSAFQEVMEEAKACRIRLAQSVDQTLHFSKTRSADVDRLSVCFGKVSSSASDLETLMHTLEKDITSFDLNLTKAHILVEGNHRDKNGESSMENLFEDFKAISYKIENDMKSLQQAFSQNRDLEESIVENITIFDQYFSRSISEDNNVKDLSSNDNDLDKESHRPDIGPTNV